MTEALKNPPRFPAGTRSVGWGPDTAWFHWHAPVSTALVSDLIEQREQAALAKTPRDKYPTVDLAGQQLTVSVARGTVAGTLLLKNDNFAVHLNPAPLLRGMPTILIEIRSIWICQRGIDQAVEDACAIVREVTPDGVELPDEVIEPLPTRLDLRVDFQGLDLQLQDLVPPKTLGLGPNAPGLRSRADWDRPHIFNGQVTGAEYGKKSSPVSAGIYDKSLEIKQASGKEWFAEEWKKSPLYDPEERVMRLEFRLRREWFLSRECQQATCGKKLSTWTELRAHLKAVWHYLTTRWLVWRGHRTKATRNTVDIRWQPFVDIDDEMLHDGCPTTLLKRVEKLCEMAIAQTTGYRAANWAHAELVLGKPITEEQAKQFIDDKVQQYAENSARGTVEQRKNEKLEKLLALAGPELNDDADLPHHPGIPPGWASIAAQRALARLERERRWREGHQAPPRWHERSQGAG